MREAGRLPMGNMANLHKNSGFLYRSTLMCIEKSVFYACKGSGY